MHLPCPALRSRLARVALGACLLAAALSTTGCISIEALIRLNPDGSGTLASTITIQRAFIQQIQAMAALSGEAGEGGETTPPDMFSEETLQQMAAGMGPGVRLVSSKKISNDAAEGAEMVVAFDDINQLQAGQALNVLGGGGGDGGPGQMHMRLERAGDRSVLVVEMPPPQVGAEEEAGAPAEASADAAVDPQQMAMFSQMFRGLKMKMDLEVAGKLLDTNARYVEGNRITLLEVDFDRILASEGALEKVLQGGQPGSLAELQEKLAGVPGLKLNLDGDLRVEFK